MGLALDAAGGVPEPTAWAHVELAKLDLGDGRVSRSEGARRRGADGLPRICPRARAARARRGRGGPSRGGGRDRAPRRRIRAAPAVRRVARRPARSRGADEQGGSRSGRRWRPSTGCWQRTGCGSTSSPRCSAPTTGCGPPRQSASPVVRGLPDRPSTETTRSAGRSPGQGAATRQCACSTAPCGSGRETRSSTSTAGTRPAAPETAAAMRDWYRRAHRAEPRVLGALGASRPKGTLVKRVVALAAVLVAVTAADTRTTGRRRRAPARELHRQPLRGHRACRQPRVRAVRRSTSPRSRRTRTADASARAGTRQTSRASSSSASTEPEPASCPSGAPRVVSVRERAACRRSASR